MGDLLAEASLRLAGAGVPSPRLDAEVLLAHLLGRDRAWLLAHPEAPVGQPDAYRTLVGRRAAGEPVAYLRGFKEWRSIRVRTDARALSPRPETEILVDAALAEIDRRLPDQRVVAREVGTGTGAVAVALGLERIEALRSGRLRLVATDVSADALALAGENLADHGLETLVELHVADLLEGEVGDAARPDVVVANLPYVPTAEIAAAGPFLAHEPRMALDGGPDGLDVIRRVLRLLPGRVAAGASVLLEIGAGQASAVAALAPPGASVDVLADLAGIDRVVHIRMAD